jgi:hypothetical protein
LPGASASTSRAASHWPPHDAHAPSEARGA